MRMISYAQNAEDVLLDRLFPDGDGFYIDVGANHPVRDSVTKHFYDRGWFGINVEPEPTAFEVVRAARGRDLNENVGISDREGEMTFYEAPAASGWSTFSPLQAEGLRRRGLEIIERKVAVTTLASLCDRLVPAGATIDFLKIDAESHELEVIRGGDWSRWRPRVVLVEANDYREWDAVLSGNDYLFSHFDGINRYYLRREDEGLRPRLAAGANALDDFARFDHVCAVEELRSRLSAIEDLGPTTLGIARGLHRLSKRFPRAASATRTLLGPIRKAHSHA